VEDPSRLQFVWREQGRRADPLPTSRGFGLEAIEDMLPYQLQAQSDVQFLPDGLRCTITLPFAPSSQVQTAG
jgi:two-component sensor histidine kinase